MAFGDLQEKAKVILNNSTTAGVKGVNVEGGNNTTSAAQLLQFIEDFCREGDRVVDENKRDKVDLQKQVRWHGVIDVINIELACCSDWIAFIEIFIKIFKNTTRNILFERDCKNVVCDLSQNYTTLLNSFFECH